MPDRARGIEYQANVVAEFRANGGQVGGYFANMALLLLVTKGARTGRRRITPLSYATDGDRYVLAAANAGLPTNPAWYHNVVADPKVAVEIGTDTFDATATIVTGPERAALFAVFAADHPQLEFYQSRTTRQIPMITLVRD